MLYLIFGILLLFLSEERNKFTRGALTINAWATVQIFQVFKIN